MFRDERMRLTSSQGNRSSVLMLVCPDVQWLAQIDAQWRLVLDAHPLLDGLPTHTSLWQHSHLFLRHTHYPPIATSDTDNY